MKRGNISSNFFSNVKFDPHQFPWPLAKKITQCLQETKNVSETKYMENLGKKKEDFA